jgi:uncharacterized iron-regulated membrane protein
MTSYLFAAIAALTLVLAGTGYFLKQQIQTNGELKAQAVQRDQTIREQGRQIEQAQKDREKLDEINAKRDSERAANESRSDAGKDAVRVAALQPTAFADCYGVDLPSDVVQRLRNASDRDAGDKAVPARASAHRVSHTYR